MMQRPVAVAFIFAALLAASCSLPFLETAQDPKGFSAQVAVAGISQYSDNDGYRDWLPELIVAGRVRQRFGERFSLSLGLGATPWFANRWFVPAFGAELGAKLVFGKRDALKLLSGGFFLLPYRYSEFTAAPWASLNYLHDFSPSITGNLGLGIDGLSAGLGWHSQVARQCRWHIGAQGRVWIPNIGMIPYIGASAGASLEFVPKGF